MATARTTPRTTRPTKPVPRPRAARTSKTVQPAQPVLNEPVLTLTLDENAIAVRAYEIFLARDGTDGDSLADWLEAERQLTARA